MSLVLSVSACEELRMPRVRKMETLGETFDLGFALVRGEIKLGSL